MTTALLTQLVSGAMVAMYAIIALFFVRFWRETRDRLFGMFALAFAVLGAQRLALALSGRPTEDATALYVVRLVAFLIIFWAIVDKNRASRE